MFLTVIVLGVPVLQAVPPPVTVLLQVHLQEALLRFLAAHKEVLMYLQEMGLVHLPEGTIVKQKPRLRKVAVKD